MSFWSKIKQSIGFSEEKPRAAAAAADSLMDYVFSLINREDLIADQIVDYKEAKRLPEAERGIAYIPIYDKLEKFILENKPLVVKKEFTRESLHADIREHISFREVGERFRVFFLPDIERVFTLYNMALDFPYRVIIDNLGRNRLLGVVDKATQGTILEKANFDGSRFHFDVIAQTNPSREDVVSSFAKLNSALYDEISAGLGKEKAESATRAMREFVERTYAAAAAADFNTYLAEISRGLGAEEQKAVIPITHQAREMITDIGMGELITHGIITGVESNLMSKQGEEKPVSVSASALKDDAGNIQGMVITAKDLSEIRRLEADKVKILEHAKEVAEAEVAQRTQELERAKGDLEKSLATEKASTQQLKAAQQQQMAANQQLAAAQKNLQDKLLELERFNKVAVGRELKMVELKEEIARLKGQPQKVN